MNKERKIVSTSLPMIQKEKVPFACVCVWERERERERFRFWGGCSWGPKTWGSLNVHLMYEVSPCWSFHVQREREREREIKGWHPKIQGFQNAHLPDKVHPLVDHFSFPQSHSKFQKKMEITKYCLFFCYYMLQSPVMY